MIGTVVFVVFIVLVLVSLYFKSTNPICTSIDRIEGKVCIVTGGTAGMGLEIAKDLARRGARVIIACPFQEEGNNAREHIVEKTENNDVLFKLLDLSSMDSVRKFASDILKSEDRLDILVNNAGGFFSSTTQDGLHATMQVNYLGHFLLTILLLPLLKKSKPSRIVNVSSILHLFGDGKVEGLCDREASSIRSYTNSKLCMALFTRKLSRLLDGTGVVVNTADPGLVGTNIVFTFWTFSNFSYDIIRWCFCQFYKDPWEGAQTAIHVAVDTDAGAKTGLYFKDCKERKISSKLQNEQSVHDVWEESKRLVKLKDSELIW